ncbi:MAG: translation elongation factor Ts [Planctomycetes bacterium]|nr:translation elongation factor Ts [Planctomycetota bacterium]
MDISAQQVKALREKTGAGLMDCKRALVQAEGDVEKARSLLREKGLATARGKSGRETSEGAVFSYIHGNGRIGVLVELACETDFVARSEEFVKLGKELAMQVAATGPEAVTPKDLPADTIEQERNIYLGQFADKPQQIRDKIIEGKLEKFYEEVCLLQQPYIRDEDRKVQDIVDEAIAILGENIKVQRFVRLELGR